MENPEQYLLGRMLWQLFASLTFKAVPSEEVRIKAAFAWLRGLGDRYRGVHFHSLHWVLRQELGESTGRPHLHLLIGNLPPQLITERTCLVAMQDWEARGGGMARVRIFDPALDGVGYVLKGETEAGLTAQNAYEFEKFRGGCQIMLAKSVVSYLARQRKMAEIASSTVPNGANTSDPWALTSWQWSKRRHPYYW